MILLAVYLIGTIFLGRVFCGYICPFGSIQEWIYKIARKLHIPQFELPEKFDKYLRYIKYLVLLIIVYYSFYLGDLVFRNYDPYNALMHFGNEFTDKTIAYTLLGIVLLLSLFSKNIWCRYFCPLGAFFGITKKFSFLKLKRDNNTCIKCNACDIVCPANLPVKDLDIVTSADCISCSQCVGKCPKSSLSYSIFGKTISRNQHLLLVVLMVILPIFIISNTPYWQTKTATNLVTSDGKIDVDNIRGSNTLNNLVETTKIPMIEYQKEFGLPENIDGTIKLKDIATKYGIKNKNGDPLEVEDIREFIINKIK
jgi:NapH/MauN family ferredoxin-type protein